jgi:hypothetical protein
MITSIAEDPLIFLPVERWRDTVLCFLFLTHSVPWTFYLAVRLCHALRKLKSLNMDHEDIVVPSGINVTLHTIPHAWTDNKEVVTHVRKLGTERMAQDIKEYQRKWHNHAS